MLQHAPEKQIDPHAPTTAGAAAMLAQPQGVAAVSYWKLAADAALRLRYWDDECVLFHGASGDTHRLPAAVGRLIEHLAEAPAAVAELSEVIDLHEDDVALSLAELGRLGIVETV